MCNKAVRRAAAPDGCHVLSDKQSTHRRSFLSNSFNGKRRTKSFVKDNLVTDWPCERERGKGRPRKKAAPKNTFRTHSRLRPGLMALRNAPAWNARTTAEDDHCSRGTALLYGVVQPSLLSERFSQLRQIAQLHTCNLGTPQTAL